MVSKSPKRRAQRTRYPTHVRLYGCAESLRKIATKRDMEPQARNLIHGIAGTIEQIAESMHLHAEPVKWTGEYQRAFDDFIRRALQDEVYVHLGAQYRQTLDWKTS